MPLNAPATPLDRPHSSSNRVPSCTPPTPSLQPPATSAWGGYKGFKPQPATIEEYAAAERAAHARLERYAARPGDQWYKFDSRVVRQRAPHAAGELFANNVESRIGFNRVLLKAIDRVPALVDGPVHMVTLVSTRFMVPINEALLMTHSALSALIFRLQQLVRQALRGISFIGFVEAVLYKDWGPTGTTPGHDSIFWHAHVMTFDATREQIELWENRVGEKHTSVQGEAPVHVKYVPPERLIEKVLYIAKTPARATFLNPKIDPLAEAGAPVERLQQKRDMRPWERVIVSNAMAGITLDQLLFAGVDGREIVASVKKTAPAAFEGVKRRRDHPHGHGAWTHGVPVTDQPRPHKRGQRQPFVPMHLRVEAERRAELAKQREASRTSWLAKRQVTTRESDVARPCRG